MARRKNSNQPDAHTLESTTEVMIDSVSDNFATETTGGYIIIFKDNAYDDVQYIQSTLNNVAGFSSGPTSADYAEGNIVASDLDGQETFFFNRLGIAVVSGNETVQPLMTSALDINSPILSIEPEYLVYPSNNVFNAQAAEYLRGYRDAVNHLYEQLVSDDLPTGIELANFFQDTSQFTWGLQATKVNISRFSGKGMKVAVLDTGLDLTHPDFQGRAIQSQSFVSGVTVDDVNGHGTHCIGTACGSLSPASGVRRYGVACNAEIFVGKVFDNRSRPSAPTRSIIAGIEWALRQGCQVASLSLGASVNNKILQYDVPLRRVLQAGLLVVAAAGNNANRPMNPGFVEPPANSDDALAVAALDNQLRIANFSGRSSLVTGQGGKVNIAGPGVSVFSSYLQGEHTLLNGTSMATPHVAGIAALWAEATGDRGVALWRRLEQSALPLTLPSVDVGVGLVQAPQ
jgi:hypothetical protein